MEEIELGDAFLIDTPPNDRHLYIVIAFVSENNYLLVNTTTSNKQIDPDKDCVINPGEGIPDFIDRQSTIAYAYAREIRKNQINKIIREGQCQHCGRFPVDEVYKIQERGAFSTSLAKKYRNFLTQVLQNRELDRYICEKLNRRLG
jgi:hypothetical protein